MSRGCHPLSLSVSVFLCEKRKRDEDSAEGLTVHCEVVAAAAVEIPILIWRLLKSKVLKTVYTARHQRHFARGTSSGTQFLPPSPSYDDVHNLGVLIFWIKPQLVTDQSSLLFYMHLTKKDMMKTKEMAVYQSPYYVMSIVYKRLTFNVGIESR